MNDKCLACGGTGLNEILNFGPQPAANLLSDKPNDSVRKVVLALNFCEVCGHAQQKEFYPADELFSHYLYQSGTSQTLGLYFDWYADAIRSALGPSIRCLEIASNDGSFVKAMAAKGMNCIGVEPAANLVATCLEQGMEILEGFWPDARPEGKFDLITAQNVAAHTPDPFAFMSGIAQSLSKEGVALVQASQLDMFSNFEFDTLYHEHFSFYSPNSMAALAKRSGLEHVRFIKTNIHGGSLLGILGNSETTVERVFNAFQTGKYFLSILDASLRPTENAANEFGRRATQTNSSLVNTAEIAKLAGHKIVLVGAAAKAITVLQTSGMVPDHIVDEAQAKIGLYIPGTPYQIEPLANVADYPGPCVFVMGAWNFQMELGQKIRKLRQVPGDKVLCYFPQFSLRALED